MIVSRSRAVAAAVAGAALLAGTTACGPTDPLAGRDPADVLRRAYETTQRAHFKQGTVSMSTGGRDVRAELGAADPDFCEGSVTVYRAGTAQLRMERGTLLLNGDSGFLKDHFRDRPEAEAEKAAERAAGRWLKLSATDRAAAHLVALCTAGAAPATAFSLDRTGIRREPDTAFNGSDVAVFTSTDANGSKITDEVVLADKPYLFKRNQQTGNAFDAAEYRIVHIPPLKTPVAPGDTVEP
ncbi:hypothetical protein SUDANB120_02527 [Streptomyces sp. enrichment culture]|uniref:hypothetical protein n=1 Tax=Streptomyces sp. enrichment culture TaxID=1795815 RepID=UPI003F5758D7